MNMPACTVRTACTHMQVMARAWRGHDAGVAQAWRKRGVGVPMLGTKLSEKVSTKKTSHNSHLARVEG